MRLRRSGKNYFPRGKEFYSFPRDWSGILYSFQMAFFILFFNVSRWMHIFILFLKWHIIRELFYHFIFRMQKKMSCMLFFCFSFSCFFYLFIIDSDDDDDKASFGNNGTIPYFLCLNFWNPYFSVFFMLLRFVYAVSTYF